MSTVIETLKRNGTKLYEYTGTIYGNPGSGVPLPGLDWAEALESCGDGYGEQENAYSDNADLIEVDGEVVFVRTEAL